ncbi:hypothetical protein C0J52_14272, partial [Blattella germanica]
EHACEDFRCNREFCIHNDLVCDEVNHCGDSSDEMNNVCPQSEMGMLGVSSLIVVVVIVSTLLVLCAGAVACVVFFCRRTNHHGRSPHHQSSQQQPPNASFPSVLQLSITDMYKILAQNHHKSHLNNNRYFLQSEGRMVRVGVELIKTILKYLKKFEGKYEVKV